MDTKGAVQHVNMTFCTAPLKWMVSGSPLSHGFFADVHGDIDFQLFSNFAVCVDADVAEVAALGLAYIGDGDLVFNAFFSGDLFK